MSVHSVAFSYIEKYLTSSDREMFEELKVRHQDFSSSFAQLGNTQSHLLDQKLIPLYRRMSHYMRDKLKEENSIFVHNFVRPTSHHGEVSRLIAKLRDETTLQKEFIYYTQRAYELLFNLAFRESTDLTHPNNYLTVPTLTNHYAIHNIPNVDNLLKNITICTLLRGALLPSMIMGKEIEENSLSQFISPFALFKIKRLEEKNELYYAFDVEKSFFCLQDLNQRDWLFSDPINATGGSIISVVEYLKKHNIHPNRIYVFNIIASFQGLITLKRALPQIKIYSLWVDPTMNEKYYVLPGLGDAGDRLSGPGNKKRNILQLIANYGSDIINLYRRQVETIENIIFS